MKAARATHHFAGKYVFIYILYRQRCVRSDLSDTQHDIVTRTHFGGDFYAYNTY